MGIYNNSVILWDRTEKSDKMATMYYRPYSSEVGLFQDLIFMVVIKIHQHFFLYTRWLIYLNVGHFKRPFIYLVGTNLENLWYFDYKSMMFVWNFCWNLRKSWCTNEIMFNNFLTIHVLFTIITEFKWFRTRRKNYNIF